MIANIESIKSGFCLTDIADPRYQYTTSLKRRFGIFLHTASVNLRQQGEENTVDAVDMLVSVGLSLSCLNLMWFRSKLCGHTCWITAIAGTGTTITLFKVMVSSPLFTSYFMNDEQYRSEKNIARQYAHQKEWPRAVHVRRAR
jgi:proteasome activator subunit 4